MNKKFKNFYDIFRKRYAGEFHYDNSIYNFGSSELKDQEHIFDAIRAAANDYELDMKVSKGFGKSELYFKIEGFTFAVVEFMKDYVANDDYKKYGEKLYQLIDKDKELQALLQNEPANSMLESNELFDSILREGLY